MAAAWRTSDQRDESYDEEHDTLVRENKRLLDANATLHKRLVKRDSWKGYFVGATSLAFVGATLATSNMWIFAITVWMISFVTYVAAALIAGSN
jgi:hypothetical protein